MNTANQIVLMIACGFAGGAIAFGIDKLDARPPATWFPTIALTALAAAMLLAALK